GGAAVGQFEQRPAGGGLEVGGADHGQPAAGQAAVGHQVQHLEGVGASRLIRFVVADQAAEVIGGEDFRRPKVPAGEGRFAGAGGADQQHQAQLRDGQDAVSRAAGGIGGHG